MGPLLDRILARGACTVIASSDQDRPAWLAARRPLITASDLPKVLGLKRGAPRLWYEKAGLIPEDHGESEPATMGRDLEDANAMLFVKKTGRQVERAQVLLQSTRYPWLGATLDYGQLDPERGDVGPIELKVTGKKSRFPEQDEPTLEFVAQLQQQLIVTGCTWGSLSAVIGQPYVHHRYRDYDLHPGFAELVLTRTQAFQDSIAAGVPPVDADDDTSNALALLVPDASEFGVLPMEALGWAAEIEKAKKEARDAEKRKRYYENLIVTAMGGRVVGFVPQTTLVYSFAVESKKGYTVQPSTKRRLKRIQ